MKIKVITGFRKDQQFSIDMQEAHKAYYLFLNPDARSIFNDGLALKGSEIQRIEPDYQGTMGWNQTHTLDSDDMNDIRSRGVEHMLRTAMTRAKEVAQLVAPESLALPLSEASQKLLLAEAPQ